MEALGSDESDAALRPRACPLEAGEMCGAHQGLRDVQARVRALLATLTLGPVLSATCEGGDRTTPPPRSSRRKRRPATSEARFRGFGCRPLLLRFRK